MRSVVLVAIVAILAGTPAPVLAQKADMARFHRASVRALNHENATAVLNQAMKGKKPEEARATGQQLAARGVVRQGRTRPAAQAAHHSPQAAAAPPEPTSVSSAKPRWR